MSGAFDEMVSAIRAVLGQYCFAISDFAVTHEGQYIIYSASYTVPSGYETWSEITKWDAVTGSQTTISSDYADDLEVSPEGKYLFLRYANVLTMKNLGTGEELAACRSRSDESCLTIITSHGFRIVSGSADGTLRVTDLFSGAEIACCHVCDGPIKVVAMTPDGGRVLFSDDTTVRVWDLSAAKEIGRFQSHELWTVHVTPDGCRAVSGSNDGMVRVCDLTSGTEVARFFADAAVTSVAAPASNVFVAASKDGAVHILELKGAGSAAEHQSSPPGSVLGSVA